jgi:molybdopterin converting factor small subunit
VTVQVKLFALAKQLAGRDSVALLLPDGATVADVRRELPAACPALRGLIDQTLIAVDSEYAADAKPVESDSEVACIPPVSGGCGDRERMP